MCVHAHARLHTHMLVMLLLHVLLLLQLSVLSIIIYFTKLVHDKKIITVVLTCSVIILGWSLIRVVHVCITVRMWSQWFQKIPEIFSDFTDSLGDFRNYWIMYLVFTWSYKMILINTHMCIISSKRILQHNNISISHLHDCFRCGTRCLNQYHHRRYDQWRAYPDWWFMKQ